MEIKTELDGRGHLVDMLATRSLGSYKFKFNLLGREGYIRRDPDHPSVSGFKPAKIVPDS